MIICFISISGVQYIDGMASTLTMVLMTSVYLWGDDSGGGLVLQSEHDLIPWVYTPGHFPPAGRTSFVTQLRTSDVPYWRIYALAT